MTLTILHIEGVGVVEAKFAGYDYTRDINGKVFFVYPGVFMSASDFADYKHTEDFLVRSESEGYKSVWAWFYNIHTNDDDDEVTFTEINTDIVFDIDYNVDHIVYYNTMLSKVENVPDYFITIYDGCAPTGASMLVAYYDNEYNNNFSTLEGIYSWNYFPSIYTTSSSTSPVTQLMEEIAIDMGCYATACVGGVEKEDISLGINQYLDTHLGTNYTFVFSPINDLGDNGDPITSTPNYWIDYKDLIDTGNPAILLVGEDEYTGKHVVLGMGYLQTMSPITTGFYVYDGFSDNGSGVTWIKRDFVHYFGYIIEYDAS